MTESSAADPGFWTKTTWIQLGYGVWVSMSMVEIGLALGFPAVTIPQLTDAKSAIKITTSDESWIASVMTLVAPVGCLVCGYLMDKMGRKMIMVTCELPICLGWVYTGLATSATHIIIGRIITGVGCGMAMGAPRIYITEITLPNMRGVIGAFPNLAISVGLTLLAAIGAFFEWTTICFVSGAFALALLLLNMLLPETPYFTLLKGSNEAALASLKKFRAANYNTDKEIDEMLEYKMENNIRRLKFIEDLMLLMTKMACKPFFIIFVYLIITQLAGATIMFMWTIELLEASKSSVDSSTGNFIMGLTRFLTGILSSILLFQIGRKPQALVSSFGVGFVCIVLSLVIHYNTAPNVIPQICYVSYVIFATIGYYTLPLLIMYELYPLQVRGFLGGITVSLYNILIFGVNKLYPYLRNLIGHANIILCFGVFSFLGCLFLYFFLPETKGLTLQEIEEYFNDRRSTLVSQRRVLAAQLNKVGPSRSAKDLSSSRSQLNIKPHKLDHKYDILRLKKKKKNDPSASTSVGSKDDENARRTSQQSASPSNK